MQHFLFALVCPYIGLEREYVGHILGSRSYTSVLLHGVSCSTITQSSFMADRQHVISAILHNLDSHMRSNGNTAIHIPHVKQMFRSAVDYAKVRSHDISSSTPQLISTVIQELDLKSDMGREHVALWRSMRNALEDCLELKKSPQVRYYLNVEL